MISGEKPNNYTCNCHLFAKRKVNGGGQLSTETSTNTRIRKSKKSNSNKTTIGKNPKSLDLSLPSMVDNRESSAPMIDSDPDEDTPKSPPSSPSSSTRKVLYNPFSSFFLSPLYYLPNPFLLIINFICFALFHSLLKLSRVYSSCKGYF